MKTGFDWWIHYLASYGQKAAPLINAKNTLETSLSDEKKLRNIDVALLADEAVLVTAATALVATAAAEFGTVAAVVRLAQAAVRVAETTLAAVTRWWPSWMVSPEKLASLTMAITKAVDYLNEKTGLMKLAQDAWDAAIQKKNEVVAHVTDLVNEIKSVTESINSNQAKLGQILDQLKVLPAQVKAETDQWFATDPLLIDLTGHGVHTVALANSTAAFAFQPGDAAVRTGWMAAGTGMLVTLDANGAPVPFMDSAAFQDAFASLASHDANHDGDITAADPIFASLRVWIGGDGSAGSGQLLTLDQLGIVSINLTETAVNSRDNGNAITGVSSVTFADGTTHQIAAVTFSTGAAVQTAVTTVDFTADTASHTYVAGAGDAVIAMGAGGGSVKLGAGMDVVIGGQAKDQVTFGAGVGTFTGGGGNDVMVFIKGNIVDPATTGGRYDRMTDFQLLAADAGGRSGDFIALNNGDKTQQQFSAATTITYAGDIGAGQHLYTITDGAYTAKFELDYAGPGVQLGHGQWVVAA